jgi:hypothetical protein
MLELPATDAGSTIDVTTTVRALQIENGEAMEESTTVTIEVQEAQGFVLPRKDEDVVAEVMAYRLAEIKRRAIDAAMQLPDTPYRKAMVVLASQLLNRRT